MTLYLRDDIAELWRGQDPFDAAEALSGDIYRQLDGRRTLRFEVNGRGYFIKIHDGVGWPEIFKNLISGRLPVISARQEYLAIRALNALHVPTMTVAAFGEKGFNPARRHSFLITDELHNTISLETLCARWPEQRPAFRFKQQLILEVARISRSMHSGGLCHRDFYLCHFLLDCADRGDVDESQAPRLHLIDLHRALLSQSLRSRWIEKDIAGLYFSSLEIGLTRTDLCRFVEAYSGLGLREALTQKAGFWSAVVNKAHRIQARDRRKQLRRQAAGQAGQ